MEENQQAWDLPWGRTVSKRTIWRPALTIQSFIRICGRPLVWFAMANEFCRLGQLDISPLFARVGHPEFTECSTPFVFHHPLVRPFSTRARTTHYIIYTYTYIYLYLYIYLYIYISRVSLLYELRSPSRTSPGNSSSRTVTLILIIVSRNRSSRASLSNRHNDAPG